MAASHYNQIIEGSNLLRAYRKAAKGKRGKASTALFEFNLGDQIVSLQDELANFTYRPGAYVHFTIHDPKRRRISAAPFRDRVVHHALCTVIEPLFERQFIAHSYANRLGKGTHRAVEHLQRLARGHDYVLRADIVGHFPSIDHAILTDILADTIRDENTLWLTETILRSGAGVLTEEYQMVYFPDDDIFAPNRPRGLPIGNLTSQFWSNVYMTPLDWFVTQELGCTAYLRYVDDFALFSDSKRQLYEWKRAIMLFLETLRLVIHEPQAQVVPCTHGIPWLGFVVYPSERRLKRRNAINFTRRLEQNYDRYADGKISFAELTATVQGWIAHVRHADTRGLRRYIFNTHPIPKLKNPKI